MNRRITVLGSTGSIGIQTLEVANNLRLEVCGLTAASNLDLLEAQARQYKPSVVAIADSSLYNDLKIRLRDTNIKILAGQEGICEIAGAFDDDIIVLAISGIAGLLPLIAAIRNNKKIALANKESLITGGCIVKRELEKSHAQIIPIDSEHSAIFQCLMGNDIRSISKIFLTGSGGPFRGRKKKDLINVTPQEALVHPNWTMGRKITIDSATLMNKGLEVIEAYWLFGVDVEKIQVIIHPQSIIHSMVEFFDGSIIAQLATHDMKLPIQFALTYPDRIKNNFEKLDILHLRNLEFYEPDYETFNCLSLAINALKIGGSMTAAMNAANDKAVELFLNNKIGFNDIPCIIENIMVQHNVIVEPSLDDILDIVNDVTNLLNRRYR